MNGSNASLAFCFALALWVGQAVATAAVPSNDAFANAIPLVGTNVSANASNVGASKQSGEPNHAGDAGGRSVWWSWHAPFTGSVVMQTTGSSFDTLLAVYTGATVSTLTLVAANDQDMLDPLGGDTSRLKFNAVAGTTYFMAVDGFSGASGAIVLTIAPPPRPPNDNFANRLALTGAPISTTGQNLEATMEENEPLPVGEFGGRSVWWNWTAPFTGSATVTTLGSDFDTVLAVYSGESVDDLTVIGANDQDPIGGSTSRVEFPARAGLRYEILVDGWNAESGEIVLNVEMPPAPPALSQPRVLSSGAFQATLFGAAGRTYVMEATTTLTNAAWTSIATNQVGATGVWTFIDAPAPGSPRRFYRARLER